MDRITTVGLSELVFFTRSWNSSSRLIAGGVRKHPRGSSGTRIFYEALIAPIFSAGMIPIPK
jgi:hypothetical protein